MGWKNLIQFNLESENFLFVIFNNVTKHTKYSYKSQGFQALDKHYINKAN